MIFVVLFTLCLSLGLMNFDCFYALFFVACVLFDCLILFGFACFLFGFKRVLGVLIFRKRVALLRLLCDACFRLCGLFAG